MHTRRNSNNVSGACKQKYSFLLSELLTSVVLASHLPRLVARHVKAAGEMWEESRGQHLKSRPPPAKISLWHPMNRVTHNPSHSWWGFSPSFFFFTFFFPPKLLVTSGVNPRLWAGAKVDGKDASVKNARTVITMHWCEGFAPGRIWFKGGKVLKNPRSVSLCAPPRALSLLCNPLFWDVTAILGHTRQPRCTAVSAVPISRQFNAEPFAAPSRASSSSDYCYVITHGGGTVGDHIRVLSALRFMNYLLQTSAAKRR